MRRPSRRPATVTIRSQSLPLSPVVPERTRSVLTVAAVPDREHRNVLSGGFVRPPGRHGTRRSRRPVTCRAEGAAGPPGRAGGGGAPRGGGAGHPGGTPPMSAPSDNGRADRRQRPAVRPEDADVE